MTTLKELVDETTTIKNELVTCHSELSNLLNTKGFNILPSDKIMNLVEYVKCMTYTPPIELYNKGDEFSEITGGYIQITNGGWHVSFTKYDDYMRIYGQSMNNSATKKLNIGICSSKSIDISDYTKAIFVVNVTDISGSNSPYVAVGFGSGTNFNFSANTSTSILGEQELIVDISNLKGSFNAKLVLYDSGYYTNGTVGANLINIKLEKVVE